MVQMLNRTIQVRLKRSKERLNQIINICLLPMEEVFFCQIENDIISIGS